MKLLKVTKEQYNTTNSLLQKAKEGFDLSQFINQRPEAKLEDDIGHVYAWGMLINNAAPIEKQLGCTDYRDIMSDIKGLVKSGAKSIVMHVNSGGGTAEGAAEAAELIQNCSVPIVAQIEGLGCSAAYELSCAATYIIASKSAMCGNIGTILVMVDDSEFYSNMGINFYAFTGEENSLKSTGHLPYLTQEQADFLQESINENSEQFKQFVLANRPEIDEEVFKSGWYFGQHAINLGLIDKIGDEDDAEEIAKELSKMVTNLTI
jgi:protease-4